MRFPYLGCLLGTLIWLVIIVVVWIVATVLGGIAS